MQQGNSTAMDDHQRLNIVIPLSFLSLLIVAANTSVCMLVYIKKNLRTYTNAFVCSLAVSDVFIGSIVFPLHLADPTSPLLDHVIGVVLIAGVGNVAAVTFDRYLAVMNPLKYMSIIPKCFIPVLLATWSVPVVLTLIPFAWKKIETVIAHKIYVFILEIFGVVIPYVFVFIAYFKIFQQVKKCIKKIKRQNSFSSDICGKKKVLMSQSEGKVTWTFTLVSLVFIGSWLPVLYITTVHTLEKPELAPPHLRILSLFTLALGSLANPLLYSFLKPDFKQTMKALTWLKKDKLSAPYQMSLPRCASASVSQKKNNLRSGCGLNPDTPSGTIKPPIKERPSSAQHLLQNKSDTSASD